jgi:hypothetical protein
MAALTTTPAELLSFYTGINSRQTLLVERAVLARNRPLVTEVSGKMNVGNFENRPNGAWSELVIQPAV